MNLTVDVPKNLVSFTEQLPKNYIYSPLELYPLPEQIALWKQIFEEAQYDGKSRPGWDKNNGFYSPQFKTEDLKLSRDIND